jgi:DNA-binding NarL/FixJ family response regulator
MLTLAVFEDNIHYRESLKQLFGFIPEIELVSASPNCDNLRETVVRFLPNVILMDIDMPGMNGIDATAIVKEISPDTQVIMLTVSEDEDRIYRALCNGATGYLLKKSTTDELIDAVISINNGGSPMTPAIARKVMQYFYNQIPNSKPEHQEYPNESTIQKPKTIENDASNNLTPREFEILEGLVDGFSYKMIAGKLYISNITVRNHIQNIYRKLHVNSKGEAISFALKNNIVQ